MGSRGKTTPVNGKRTPFQTPRVESAHVKYQLLGIGVFVMAALGMASFFSTALGMVGNVMGRVMLFIAGEGRYLLPLLLGLLGVKIMAEGNSFKITARTAGIVLLYLTILFHLHQGLAPGGLFPDAMEGRGGGFLGASGAYLLSLCFGRVGTYIVLAALVTISLILITGATLGHLGLAASLRARSVGGRVGGMIVNFIFEEMEENKGGGKEKKNTPPPVPNNVTINHAAKEQPPVNIPDFEKPETSSSGKKERRERNIPADTADIEVTPLSLWDGRVYRLPPTSLLAGIKDKKAGVSDKEVSDRTRILEDTLENFGIGARVTEVSVGPAITRYEIQPPPGVKVSRIVGLSDDIALGLAAPGVRIEAPIPGKAAVGIEVPNREISMVSLRELLESREFTTPASKLTVALGKDIAGATVVADLGKMPHLLVAGATGAGKSVCINTLVASILFRATPDEVKFLMIDPKMVELTTYNGIPHLISPVVTNPKKAAGTLRWAVKEMERRYELFAGAGVRDIARYNKLCNLSQDPPPSPLPFVVIIIDELADLMMVAPADVEDSICRLAQMARAAGMHLLVATQRPSVDVITGLIKANIPSRISFAVSSQTDSRTILDMGGAEKLLGKGDMLFFPVGAPKPVRVQGAYLSDQEVEALVGYLKEQAKPEYDEQVLKMPAAEENKQKINDEEDELLPQAVQIFIESGTASISMLQRRLHIGYARAARLVDIMERKGIVGGFEGSKPRAILMSLEQFQQTFKPGQN